MSIVNLIRVNSHAGILIADEEFWRRGYRRTLYLDNLQSLLPQSFCKNSSLMAVIGIEGDPAITYEIVSKAQKRLADVIKEPDQYGREDALETLKDVVDITVEEMERIIRQRVDNQLKFAYGFSTDDLNRGYFEIGDERIDIKQDQIRSEALKWSRFDPSSRTASMLDISAIIAGVDGENGFHWYEWESESGNTYLGTGNFESIGNGSDAASLSFINFFRNQDLMERRKGLELIEAVYILLQSFEASFRFNHEVGGYPQFIFLNDEKKKYSERYKEFGGHEAKLAFEIVTAAIHHYLTRENAYHLLDELIFKGTDFTVVEEQFFTKSVDKRAMEHFLRGYKNSITLPNKGGRS